jgi:urea carboxylase
VFTKVLIANRGAIACRIERTLRRMGVASVAVFSDADAGSLHVSGADEAIAIGPPPAAQSYLNVDTLLAAAQATGAQAIHPGYGFLSENAGFAQRCADAGIAFIGPTPENMRAFGLKHTARDMARAHGVPLMPGTDLLRDAPAAAAAAQAIGYPIMLKSTAGGGGIGMRVCEDAAALDDAFAAVGRIAGSNFGDSGIFLERYVRHARHIEVQIFGDGQGRVVALGERDCSLQRRHQKVIEETPAPHLPPATRAALLTAATRLCAAAAYRSAGTVEFLYDGERDEFYFLEVNTRLQVEHGVTEQVTGIDLVEWMVRGAAGDFSFLDTPIAPPQGASIQVRLYAEDPGQDYRPSSGTLTGVRFPADARVDTWVANGTEVSAHYDPLLAKVIVTAPDRAAAVEALQKALDTTHLHGLETNLEWLRHVVRADFFVNGSASTQSLAGLAFAPAGIRVLSGGLATTIQDYPGRIGYWNVGVPPSGPMDTLAFRAGNRLLGNAEGTAGLEITAVGPTLLFHQATTICLTGAHIAATLDGVAIDAYAAVAVAPGQTLRTGSVRGAGLRAYLLIAGGVDVPVYLGSRATFTLGLMGGLAGRALASGDVLRLSAPAQRAPAAPPEGARIPAALRPELGSEWTLRVLYGPHGAPDFFTEADIATLQDAAWQVHHNSSRTGVRLVGPKPAWARRDGGEAGLHPSNIHDNAYVVGAIDFTGDMPIILGPDGPSLGGFVCPFVIIQADLWKIGQLVPGNTVRFECVGPAQAGALAADQDLLLQALPGTAAPAARAAAAGGADAGRPGGSPILGAIGACGQRPAVVYRRQGERSVLVEYGPIVLDLELRLRVHALMLYLEQIQVAGSLPGVLDITPGIRSLQVHFDNRVLTQDALLQTLADAEEHLGGLEDFAIPSRVVHLPLSWNDPAIIETVRRYMDSVRSDAPWCPDNIEFIRRINGLDSIDEVRRIVFDARYLVMGLGDVYLGAPVATPLDPRHRLVTTKYNPARTWTPPNVVGIGGAYLCIYGMEGPGGYQLFGRTIQVWNAHGRSPSFAGAKPWLLRFFDQIRFFPVSHAELMDWRRDFPFGRRSLRVEEETFRLADYRRFLADNRSDIDQFQHRRQAAFEAERAEWERRDEFTRAEQLASDAEAGGAQQRIVVPEGSEIVEAPLSGVVWKTLVNEGDRIQKGAAVVSIEAMKMQCEVATHTSGVVRAVYAQAGQPIAAGAPILAIEAEQ